MEKASQKKKDLLVSSSGYSYVVNKRRTTANGEVIYWRCSSRPCRANVIQKESFISKGEHDHPCTEDLFDKKAVQTQVLIRILFINFPTYLKIFKCNKKQLAGVERYQKHALLSYENPRFEVIFWQLQRA